MVVILPNLKDAEPPSPLATLSHGGNLAQAAKLFPDATHPWIDLSTGINPDAYPLPRLAREAYTRLPEPSDLRSLERLAARDYAVREGAEIMASAGTHPILSALPRLFPPQNIAILGPTYAEHARCWQLGGHHVKIVTEFADCVSAKIIVIVRPNNPDGRIWPLDQMMGLHRRIAAEGGMLIVDEAFIDLLPDTPSLVRTEAIDHLLILRSFGKTYGLAGLRLSFAIGASVMISQLRAELGPWPVSGPAIAVGLAAFNDPDWLPRARARAGARSQWLEERLTKARMNVKGNALLYHLVDDDRALALFRHLGQRGIFTRRFTENPNWLRIGLPASDPAILARVDAAFESFKSRYFYP